VTALGSTDNQAAKHLAFKLPVPLPFIEDLSKATIRHTSYVDKNSKVPHFMYNKAATYSEEFKSHNHQDFGSARALNWK
jgi:hypothetical protein